MNSSENYQWVTKLIHKSASFSYTLQFHLHDKPVPLLQKTGTRIAKENSDIQRPNPPTHCQGPG